MEKELVKNMPIEIIEIVIEYLDYKKTHVKNTIEIFKDIRHMGSIFNYQDIDGNIPPNIAYQCWGSGWQVLEYWGGYWEGYSLSEF